MTTEQKAKRYDEALERTRELATDLPNGRNDRLYHVWDLETIFPELKESEDERIRKEIIYHIKNCDDTIDEETEKRMLAWLEKQGEKKQWIPVKPVSEEDKLHLMIDEQKPADKVEPKFKVGDWCIDNEDGTIFQIVKVLDNTYTYKTNEYKEYSCTHYSLENDARLWTIQDAKDGDILADGNLPFILKKIDTNKYSYAYCGISVDDGFKIESDGESGEWTWMQDIKPATKEQRDLLFQKMKEAGYEWDEAKKELKKIENKPLVIDEGKAEMDRFFTEMTLKDYTKQKPDIEIKTPEESLGVDSDTYNKIVDECIYGEPKFKVGNWYQCTKDFFGKGVTFDKNTAYYCAKEGCLQNKYGCHIAIVEDLYDNFKLWTIKDARDGDVLVDEDNNIGIYKETEGVYWNSYIYLGCNNHLYGFSIGGSHAQNNTKPATKEQRDLLFQKMKEAGYEWDEKKKELRKISQEYPLTPNECIKSSWSEEDEEHVNSLLKRLECLCRKEFTTTRFAINEDEDWLKSLKEKYT